MTETQPQVGQDKPDSPGLWEREGKFWRVWHDGHYDRIQHINAHNGFSGDHNYLDHENTPTGNWRKVTAPPAPTKSVEQAKVELSKWFVEKYPTAHSWRIVEAVDKAAEVLTGCTHRDEIAGLKGIIARQDEEIKVLKELVSPTSLETDQSAAEEKPISPTMLRRYRKAAHDIGGLFTWSVQNLQKFPPPPGKEWLDEIKERLLAGAQSPAPPVPEVIDLPDEPGDWVNLDSKVQYTIDFHTGRIRAHYATEHGGGTLFAVPKGRWLKLKSCWSALSKSFDNFTNRVAELAGQPEVIEGRGQRVGDLAGTYLEEFPDGCIQMVSCGPQRLFLDGFRYIRCPAFPPLPPRPTFQAPPKPEAPYDLFEMTQGDNKGKYFWGFRNVDMGLGKGADLVIDGELRFYTSEWCRQVHRETGKPLTEEGKVICG